MFVDLDGGAIALFLMNRRANQDLVLATRYLKTNLFVARASTIPRSP